MVRGRLRVMARSAVPGLLGLQRPTVRKGHVWLPQHVTQRRIGSPLVQATPQTLRGRTQASIQVPVKRL